jgi:hypothetical protein
LGFKIALVDASTTFYILARIHKRLGPKRNRF